MNDTIDSYGLIDDISAVEHAEAAGSPLPFRELFNIDVTTQGLYIGLSILAVSVGVVTWILWWHWKKYSYADRYYKRAMYLYCSVNIVLIVMTGILLSRVNL